MSNKRQELYDRIRAASKDAVILEEMVRLGFWPARGELHDDPAEEIHQRGELERQLAALRTEQSRLHNVEALKQALHQQRLEASRQKQKETKERRERERVERAAAWKARAAHEIVYLGRGVSGGLAHTAADVARLARFALPRLETPDQIAGAMGITVPALRFLAFSRTTSTVTHYQRFEIPKKTGGTRRISAPMPRLKAAQRWLLDNVLDKVALHDAAHGFRKQRSIVSNARPHVGAETVINVDLKDFFPSLEYRRIRGLFRGLGYGEAAATIFALITSEPEVDEVELDGQTFYVASGVRRLPQGAPTSPAITNIVCRRMDARLAGAARGLGFSYTRYADDLTFSGPRSAPAGQIGSMLSAIRMISGAEGFAEHPKKTRVLRRGGRQEVTGVVVNHQLGVDRATLRRFRALLFQIGKDGPAGKTWGASPDLFASVIGYANYVRMVDPAKGEKLLAEAKRLAKQHGWKPKKRPPPKPPSGGGGGGGPTPPKPEPSTPTPAPVKKKKWWQVF